MNTWVEIAVRTLAVGVPLGAYCRWLLRSEVKKQVGEKLGPMTDLLREVVRLRQQPREPEPPAGTGLEDVALDDHPDPPGALLVKDIFRYEHTPGFSDSVIVRSYNPEHTGLVLTDELHSHQAECPVSAPVLRAIGEGFIRAADTLEHPTPESPTSPSVWELIRRPRDQ